MSNNHCFQSSFQQAKYQQSFIILFSPDKNWDGKLTQTTRKPNTKTHTHTRMRAHACTHTHRRTNTHTNTHAHSINSLHHNKEADNWNMKYYSLPHRQTVWHCWNNTDYLLQTNQTFYANLTSRKYRQTLVHWGDKWLPLCPTMCQGHLCHQSRNYWSCPRCRRKSCCPSDESQSHQTFGPVSRSFASFVCRHAMGETNQNVLHFVHNLQVNGCENLKYVLSLAWEAYKSSPLNLSHPSSVIIGDGEIWTFFTLFITYKSLVVKNQSLCFCWAGKPVNHLPWIHTTDQMILWMYVKIYNVWTEPDLSIQYQEKYTFQLKQSDGKALWKGYGVQN